MPSRSLLSEHKVVGGKVLRNENELKSALDSIIQMKLAIKFAEAEGITILAIWWSIASYYKLRTEISV